MTASLSSAHMMVVNISTSAETMTPRTSTARPAAPRPGRSLAEKYPEIAVEWDADANGTLRPEDVSYGSAVSVTWRCPKGHVYVAKVGYRTSLNRGCAVCAHTRRQAPRQGKTLAEAFPEVAADWDYEANHPLTPSDVAARSNRKAYFKCPVGHGSTESYISNRTAGNGCPECGKHRSVAANRSHALARGSLAEKHPELAKQWNIELNTFGPNEITRGSNIRVWWNCDKGHEPFLARVASRKVEQGCPACGEARRRAALMVNNQRGPKPGQSLADKRPDLMAEWDTERNTLAPTDVAVTSRKVAHWICPDGHRYERSVTRRTATTACPVERLERKAARAAA